IRKEVDSKVTVKWNGEPFDINQKGELTFTIPAKEVFKVVHVDVSDEDNQSLKIVFSNPLVRDQELDGLVEVESASSLQYAVDGNVLKVFFDQPIDGTKFVEVFPGITSTHGLRLERGYATKVVFEQIKPEVRLLHSGTILPASQNLKLNFQAVNLSRVDVKVYRIFQNNVLQFLHDNELNGGYSLRKVALPIAKQTIDLRTNKMTNYKKWNSYAVDLSSLINPEPGAIYRVEFTIKKAYSLYSCDASEVPQGEQDATGPQESESDSEDFDEWEDYDYYDYYYDWRERENPCSQSYFSNNKIATNVL